MVNVKRLTVTICFLLTASLLSAAELALNRYFTDNMVLQRDQPVVIRGSAPAGSQLTVSFGDQKQTGESDDKGRWQVTFDPMQASANGQKLTVVSDEGNHKTEISNVLVGDVYLFARQAYVDVSLGRTEEGRAAAAKYSPKNGFRAISISTVPATSPLYDLSEESTSGWVTVNRENALTMSAAAFYLAKDLSQETDVPIGIVDLNMGRYFATGWMSQKAIDEAIQRFPEEGPLTSISILVDFMKEKLDAWESGRAQKELEEYIAEMKKKAGGKPIKEPSLGLPPLENPMFPSAGFNAVINPLKGTSLKAILLQLGNDYPYVAYREIEKAGKAAITPELDAAWQENYRILREGFGVSHKTHPYVADDWRLTLGNRDLPIGLILPPASDLDTYAAHNREMRELHRRTSQKVQKLDLILPGYKNRDLSGQPSDEQLLAERCRLWIRQKVLDDKKVIASGPLLERVETDITEATIYFKEGTADGLKAKGDALEYFEGAGSDGVFGKAKATIEGSTIKLERDGPITFVRYNYTGRPDDGLVNSAGLPAIPFNTDPNWTFNWLPPALVAELPEEYTLTADKWGDSNIAIINGAIENMEAGDSEPIPVHPGPLGIDAAPFGPNIYVKKVHDNTPAQGKLQEGDLIYGVNGEYFKDGAQTSVDDTYRALADAITFSETEAGGGILRLNVKRNSKLMEIPLQLKILGTYSATSPFYCKKSRNIAQNAIDWSYRQFRPEDGVPSNPTGNLYTDLLYLLANNDPKHQGLVRRAVYEIMAEMTPVEVTQGMGSHPWMTGYLSIMLGEYFNCTGDRNVLPYLKYQADLSAESQIKAPEDTPPTKEAAQTEEQVGGWRHYYPGSPDRWKSGYGLMAPAGMACTIGMQMGKEAGLDIDEKALSQGIEHFHKGRGEYGFILYSYWNLRRKEMPEIDPVAEANGMLWSMNGKLGTGAVLFNMVGRKQAVDICARHCVYGYNNTRHGHGGMFFNNFWTPLGAHAAGDKAFMHFMKGQRWWRELFRCSDGSFSQKGRGIQGISYAIPYVAHQKRLRILGAPATAFGSNCPDYLKPALTAHQERDYARCEKLIKETMKSMVIPAQDREVVDNFLKNVEILQGSIAHDLEYVQKRIDEGKLYYAKIELPQLKGVMHPEDPRLLHILQQMESPDVQEALAKHEKAIMILRDKETQERRRRIETARQKRLKLEPQTGPWKAILPEGAPVWQMKVVEHVAHVPDSWTEKGYNDESWDSAALPITWAMDHTALFRGKFTVADKKAVKGLRVRGDFFRQLNIVVHLNGKTVAKIDNLGRGGREVLAPLNEYGMKQLTKGENIISISTRHNRRWGSYRGKYVVATPMSFCVEILNEEQE